MKTGDIMAITHPERFQDARAAHKVWTNEVQSGTRHVTVDTAFVVDMHCYETGIREGYWHIVERYLDEKVAAKGHKKWIKWLKDNPTEDIPDTLTDVY
jgi:hypothetical protein